MAMTTCPYCGEQVSEKAKKCVHCGAVLIQEKKYCAECGAELEENAKECPNCGCPAEEPQVQKSSEEPQKVEVTGVKVAKKTRIIIGIVIAVLLLGGGTLFGVLKYQKKKTSEQYMAKLQLITITMLSGASDAETCGNQIKLVWSNAIFKEQNSETDQYTMPNGIFLDFNDALVNLFLDSDFRSQIDKIEKNQETVSNLMKDLKNPPEEYSDAYVALQKFYDSYLTLTDYATDPSGSLQTYSSDFNEVDTDTLNNYNALKVYLED